MCERAHVLMCPTKKVIGQLICWWESVLSTMWVPDTKLLSASAFTCSQSHWFISRLPRPQIITQKPN